MSVGSSSSEHEGIPDDRKIKYRRQYAGPINIHYEKLAHVPKPRPFPSDPGRERGEDGAHRERWFPDEMYPPLPRTKAAENEDGMMMMRFQSSHLHKQRSDFVDYINSIEKIFGPNWEEKAKKSGKWDDVKLYMDKAQKIINETDKTPNDPNEWRKEIWKHQVNIYRIIHNNLLGKIVSTPPPPPSMAPFTGFQAYWEEPQKQVPLTPAITTTTSKPPKIPPQVMMKMAIEKLKRDYDKDGNLLPHAQQELALAALPTMVNFWESKGNASAKNGPGWQNHQYAQQRWGQSFAYPYQQRNYYRQRYPRGFQGGSFTRRFGNQFGEAYNSMYGQQPMRMFQQNVRNFQPQNTFYNNRMPRQGRQFYNSQNGQRYVGYGQQYGGYGNQLAHHNGGFGQGYRNQMSDGFYLNNEDQAAKSIQSHQSEQNLIKLTNRFNNLGNPTQATNAPNKEDIKEPPKSLSEDQNKMNLFMLRAKKLYLGKHAGLPPLGFMRGSDDANVRPTMGSFNPTKPTEPFMTRDDFGAPIKWVKSTSNKTKDGLAQVTDPITGKQRTLKINGTLFLPIPDMDLGRLDKKFKTTTKRPSTTPDMVKNSQDTAVQTLMRNTELGLLKEVDWLAFEVALGQNYTKHDVLECDSNDCQARCMRSGCDATCTGNTCSTGCVGRGCSAYCNGEGCMSMCIGEDCTSKCNGMACDSRCIGKPCEAKCKSFNCYITVNGDGKMGGGKFDDNYVDTGITEPEMLLPDRKDLVEY
ncbi:hypothetical protein O0L34_g2905 [Tuta absoluta]|nr:hypothetical protein O0L34_g2905 [Tuta absoluta]